MSSATGLGTQPPDELELRKRKAETEKAEAERDKLREELKQSKSLLARFSTIFTPLIAALTIFFGYLAATHSQRVAEADLKSAKADIAAAKADIEKTRSESAKQQLEVEVTAKQHELAQANAKLAATNKSIMTANTARHKAELAEKTAHANLSTVQKQYENVQKQYENLKIEQTKQIALGNLQKLIDILNSQDPDKQTADSRYIEDIRKEVFVLDSPNAQQARLAHLTAVAQNTSNRPALRGLLYYALFKVTSDNQWFDQIRRLASQDLLSAWPTFSSLMRLEHYDSKDRADVICACYMQYMRRDPDQRKAMSEPDELLASIMLFKFDKEATLRCRKPFLDYLAFWQLQRQEFIIKDSIILPVRSFESNGPPYEAAMIWYLKSNPDSDLHPHSYNIWSAPMQMHVPHDLEEAFASGSTRKWFETHKKLVDAWTLPGFPDLANASDTAMRNILSDVWINEADLR